MTPIITLLLCRSIPAINFSLGLLMVFFVVVNSLWTTMFYRGETFVSTALNVYQTGDSQQSPRRRLFREHVKARLGE
jgi:hypothetical protein